MTYTLTFTNATTVVVIRWTENRTKKTYEITTSNYEDVPSNVDKIPVPDFDHHFNFTNIHKKPMDGFPYVMRDWIKTWFPATTTITLENVHDVWKLVGYTQPVGIEVTFHVTMTVCHVRTYINQIYKQQNFARVEPKFTLSDIEKYEGEMTNHMREYLTHIVSKSNFVKETEKKWPDLRVLEEYLKMGICPNAFYIYNDIFYEADLAQEHWCGVCCRSGQTTR